jgi:UPF0042 nucleotide-binding protein
MKKPAIVILTGRAGAGKTTAMTAFEDAGFYCVNNMPVALLPHFLKLPMATSQIPVGFVFVMDLREEGFLRDYPNIFQDLQKLGHRLKIIFLEADEETLLKRYSYTRHHHPLGHGKTLLEAIRAEAGILRELRARADRLIDTSKFNVHQLKFAVLEMVGRQVAPPSMYIAVESFGYKFGLPPDADLIIDVRFMTNPFFIPNLRQLDGETQEIRDFVLNSEETSLFLQKFLDLLDYLIPLYKNEGKAYLTIAVGCTGGRHRSVVIARSIFTHLKPHWPRTELIHRDIGRSPSP